MTRGDLVAKAKARAVGAESDGPTAGSVKVESAPQTSGTVGADTLGRTASDVAVESEARAAESDSVARTRPGSRGCVLLDRDGVINHDTPGFYVRTPAQWRPIDGSLEAIAALCGAGFAPVVVTNQSGLGRGFFSAEVLERIHARMNDAVASAGGRLEGIYHCPHKPDEGCGCRKPAAGLVRQMERALGYSALGAPLIGDKLSDLQLARNVGARPILVRTGYGARTLAELHDSGVDVFADLAQAADALIREDTP